MEKLEPKLRTKIQLASVSMNICGNPECYRVLVEKNSSGTARSNRGRFAHIVSPGDDPKTAPRSWTEQPDGELPSDPNDCAEYLRSFNNLIFLCPSCHDEVDDIELRNDYSVERLRCWKEKQEERFNEFKTTFVSNFAIRYEHAWLPGDHIQEWGTIMGTAYDEPLPYYIVDDEILYFSPEQWAHWQKAKWAGILLVGANSTVEVAAQTIESLRETNESNLSNNHLDALINLTRRPTSVPPGVLPEPGNGDTHELSHLLAVLLLLKDSPFTGEQFVWMHTTRRTQ